MNEKIAVIGIGRLGLCLALNLERAGFNVLGVDVNQKMVDAINQRNLKTTEPFVEEYLRDFKNFSATTNLSQLIIDGIRLAFVVVPTPSLPDGGFDHGYIDDVASSLMALGAPKQKTTLVINSTTMPGYCDTLQEKLMAYNYEVIYNPEFIAQGSIIRDQQQPDQVLIGEVNLEAGNCVENIYRKLCTNSPTFCRMSRISAEITKLATNCFLTNKIAFANAVGDLASLAGAEPEKILKAIGSDRRIGESYLRYGFGYGGPCFPRDNRAFMKFSGSLSYPALLSEATDKANIRHGEFLFTEWLNKFKEQDVITFDSVTYKKGTDILEESQQLNLAVALAKAGRKVQISEQKEVIEKLKQQYGDLFEYISE